MIKFINSEEASNYFYRLPTERRIVTLSPDYVVADSLRDKSFEPTFLLFEDERGFWLHSSHKAVVPNTAHFDLQSAYGYGGPVSDCDDPSFRLDAWGEYKKLCRNAGIVVEFVRLHPLASWQAYAGTTVFDRETVMIDVQSHAWRSSYESRCRRHIKKAERSAIRVVEYAVQESYKKFANFYREGMSRIAAKEFYLFDDGYFDAISRLKGVRLLACTLEGEWIAAVLLLFGGSCVEYHLSATTELGRQLRATNLLIDAAAQLASNEGLSAVYLGGGTDGRPDNALLRFKTSFSPMRLRYNYGYEIHDSAFYQEIRSRENYSGDRVLFYRQ